MPFVATSSTLFAAAYLHDLPHIPTNSRKSVDKAVLAGEPLAPLTMAAAPDEQALMTAYAQAQGDGAGKAFEPLFRALAPRLLGFFRRSGLSQEVSEDLVQATFVRLHQARARYRPGAP